MENAGTPEVSHAVPPKGSPTSTGKSARGGFIAAVAGDLVRFSPGRTCTVARLMVREAMRLRLWIILVVGMAAVFVADLTTTYFDPVLQTTAGLIGNSQLAITLVGVAVALFLSTYSIPRELTSKTIYSLVTKPVSRLEVVAGKMLGLAVVLAAVTFGLGLVCYGYMLIRGGQVQQLARRRLEAMPPDDQPQALRSIAEHGPFRAVTYRNPSDPLTLVHLEGNGPVEWLSGYSTHRAHWGFNGLPIDQLDSGRARIVIDVELPSTPQPLTDEQRAVRVQFYEAQRTRDESFARRHTLDADGHLELAIPGVIPGRPGFYTGGIMWISLCGDGQVPLGVTNDSCRVRLPDGRMIAPGSGLKLTTSFSSNKSWIGGRGSNRLVMGRVRYDQLSPAVAASGQAVLQVDVAVPTASNVPRDARAQVVIVNEKGNRQEAAFRPEKGTTALIPIEPDIIRDGNLTVYLRSGDQRVEIGVTDESIHLQVGRRPFLFNWAKSLTMMWLSFCIIAAIGLCVSTLVGWYVAVLLTSVALVLSHIWPSVVLGARRLGFSDLGVVRGGEADRTISWLYVNGFRLIGWLLPDFDRMDYGGVVARGIDAPLSMLLAVPHGALWHALLYILAMVALGYLIFRYREVAR
ncbi:MAG: ABC transporter permease subunit [Planctomycetes bacterium]|nr:ABC transporter permease subunit [Planctomycetota bacterium]